MNLDINDLVNLNDVLLDGEILSPNNNVPTTPFLLTPDRKKNKKRAKKRRSKLQIETKRDSLGLFQNLDNKEISLLDDWSPTVDQTPKKSVSNKFHFTPPKDSPIHQAHLDNSIIETQITESMQISVNEDPFFPTSEIETKPVFTSEIQQEILKTPEKTIISNNDHIYTTPPKQIQDEPFNEQQKSEEKPKTLQDLFNSIAKDDQISSNLVGSAFKTPKSVSKMRSVIITPNLSLSSKKTPRIKLFSVTPKIPKETNNSDIMEEESRRPNSPRSPTITDLGMPAESLSTFSTPSKIQPPTPKLSTWTASPAICLSRSGLELSSPSSAFKRRMRGLPYKASPRREGMTPIPMSYSGEFSRSKLVMTPSLKRITEQNENKNDEQIQLTTSSSSIPEPPSSPIKAMLETPRKSRDTEKSESRAESQNNARELEISQQLKERAEQLSNESAESRDHSAAEETTAKIVSESDSHPMAEISDAKPQPNTQQTILNKFFADKRKNMFMKKQLVKAFEEEEIHLHKKENKDKENEENKSHTVIEHPKTFDNIFNTGIPLPKTSMPKLAASRSTTTSAASTTKQQTAPPAATKKSVSSTGVKVSSAKSSTASTTVQKKTAPQKPSATSANKTHSATKPVPIAPPTTAVKKTSVPASATKTKPAPFVAATPLSQRSVAKTASTVTKAPVTSTTKSQTTRSVFSASVKENIRNPPPTVSKLENKKRKRDDDDEFSSSSASMQSFDQLLKQAMNPEPVSTGSRRTTLLSSSLRRESSYFYRKEQEQKKREEEESDSLKLFEKQLEAAMKSGSAKANFGISINNENSDPNSPLRKKAKLTTSDN